MDWSRSRLQRPPGRPSFDVALPAPADGERTRGDVVVDEGAGSDVGAITKAHRRDQGGVGSDEDPVADGGAGLGGTVVVAGDGPGADVHPLTHVAVEHAGEVADPGSGPHGAVLDLGMRPQLYPGREHRIRTDPAVRADPDVVAEFALLEMGWADGHPIAGADIGEHGHRTDLAAGAERGGAAEG